MYQLIKDSLEKDTYTLDTAIARIDYLVAAGKLTPDDATELRAIAAARAVPEVLTLEALAARITDMEASTVSRLDMIEGALVEFMDMMLNG